MKKDHVMGLACTIQELPEMLKDYCKKYGKEMGTEISVRFGYDKRLDGSKYKTCRVFVSRTPEDTNLRGGSHTEYYTSTEQE